MEEAAAPECTLGISSPLNNQGFGFNGSVGSYNQVSIPLNAVSNCSGTAGWTFSTSYRLITWNNYIYTGSQTSTSQPLNQTVTFTTPAGNGGIAEMTAAAFGTSQTVAPYIDGSTIPNNTIIAYLGQIYGGATPNLLVGVATHETSCAQFYWADNQAYALLGYWPFENSGRTVPVVGMMQISSASAVGLSMAILFDWTANAQAGLTVFQASLTNATTMTNQLIAAYPTLPAKTAVQLENDGLWLYGGFGGYGTKLLAQPWTLYWIPNASNTGWVQSTADPDGTAFISAVYTYAANNNCINTGN